MAPNSITVRNGCIPLPLPKHGPPSASPERRTIRPRMTTPTKQCHAQLLLGYISPTRKPARFSGVTTNKPFSSSLRLGTSIRHAVLASPRSASAPPPIARLPAQAASRNPRQRDRLPWQRACGSRKARPRWRPASAPTGAVADLGSSPKGTPARWRHRPRAVAVPQSYSTLR